MIKRNDELFKIIVWQDEIIAYGILIAFFILSFNKTTVFVVMILFIVGSLLNDLCIGSYKWIYNTNYNIVNMKVFQNSSEETPINAIRKKNHQHVDIFNTKDAGHLVIRNDEPVVKDNIFQKNVDDALEKYEGKTKRPSSSYNKSSVTYR